MVLPHLKAEPQRGPSQIRAIGPYIGCSSLAYYRDMVLRFTELLRDLEAFLHYVTIVVFRFYLPPYLLYK